MDLQHEGLFCIQSVSCAVIESHIHKRKQPHIGRLDTKHYRVHVLDRTSLHISPTQTQ